MDRYERFVEEFVTELLRIARHENPESPSIDVNTNEFATRVNVSRLYVGDVLRPSDPHGVEPFVSRLIGHLDGVPVYCPPRATPHAPRRVLEAAVAAVLSRHTRRTIVVNHGPVKSYSVTTCAECVRAIDEDEIHWIKYPEWPCDTVKAVHDAGVTVPGYPTEDES